MPDAVTTVLPWKASDAVAPGSLYVEPSSTVSGFKPLIVITGGILSSYPSSPSAEIAATPIIPAIAF